ncbi:LysR family transcriptional regulator [Burkholderia dolosa]|uniref:LysR substrate-binding domain-containing protein n=1 Tax=Burkholderia dolosa TaxID=152500 RepID=UPI001B98D197|nr:LysR substrate-binding domain-containing protein [Burkholderia dolosa]MBR8302336.1 LysR family transcriptional regulator [Burkholderia dolosa]MBY4830966.1 LysR family transcriptional regulator [Burkholderia dolosa]
MDLRQLRYFVKVVECANVTRASEMLHVAQPAVSQQIRNLESEMGMLLLDRSSQGVTPTAAGLTLHRHALQLLREADRTRELLRQDAETPQGKVTVGLPSSTSRVLAMPLALAVRARYPGIVLELMEVPSAELPEAISSGRIDVAIVADAVQARGIKTEYLLSEALYLFAWQEFDLRREPIRVTDLSRMPLVLPSAPNSIRTRVELALRERGLACHVVLEASSAALLFSAVAAKIGVTVLPWSAAHAELDRNTLKLVRINNRHFKRDLSLCWRDTPLLSNAVVKVKATMMEMASLLSERTKGEVVRKARQSAGRD